MDVTPVMPGGPQLLPLPGGKGQEGSDFKQLVQHYLEEVSELQQKADKSVFELASGKTDDLHQVVAAITEADLSFRLMMQIRNKLLEAYQQIMRMQV